MSTLNLKSISLIVLIAVLAWPLFLKTCNARKERQWRAKKNTTTSSFEKKARGSSSPALLMRHNYIETEEKAEKSGGKSSVFNVLDYGAEGDGKADDTKVSLKEITLTYYIFCYFCFINYHRSWLIWILKMRQAFETAWEAACKVKASTIVVPTGSVFLVKPISLIGPCEPDIVFQVTF